MHRLMRKGGQGRPSRQTGNQSPHAGLSPTHPVWLPFGTNEVPGVYYMEDAVKNPYFLHLKIFSWATLAHLINFDRSITICFVTLITLAMSRRIVLKDEQHER